MNRVPARTINVSRSDLAVCLLLVLGGAGVRVVFQDIPNFAPIAALALFSGYYFSQRWLAMVVPFAAMTISDRFVDGGTYALPLMMTVYSLLALPVLFRGILRSKFSLQSDRWQKALTSLAGLLGCGLASSMIFFLGTNFMVWATSSWYEPNLAGLITCFTGALPFFRYTLMGDCVFALLTFGGYAAVMAMAIISACPPLRPNKVSRLRRRADSHAAKS